MAIKNLEIILPIKISLDDSIDRLQHQESPRSIAVLNSPFENHSFSIYSSKCSFHSPFLGFSLLISVIFLPLISTFAACSCHFRHFTFTFSTSQIVEETLNNILVKCSIVITLQKADTTQTLRQVFLVDFGYFQISLSRNVNIF